MSQDHDKATTNHRVQVLIARTADNTYRVGFRGQTCPDFTLDQLRELFPDVPRLAVGQEIVATWMAGKMHDV